MPISRSAALGPVCNRQAAIRTLLRARKRCIYGNHLLFTDAEIGELGTLALPDGFISSPAVRTPLSSIRLYRDDRSSLPPPLPFFVLLPLLRESMSASLIRRELRKLTSGMENMLIDDPFDLPSFVIFCSPVRYRFCRDGRAPDASTLVVNISGEDGNDASGEGVLESAWSGSRGDHGGAVSAFASFT